MIVFRRICAIWTVVIAIHRGEIVAGYTTVLSDGQLTTIDAPGGATSHGCDRARFPR
jgi:hypothetical protein